MYANITFDRPVKLSMIAAKLVLLVLLIQVFLSSGYRPLRPSPHSQINFTHKQQGLSNTEIKSQRVRQRLYLSNQDGFTLGAPRVRPSDSSYRTKGDIIVQYQVEDVEDINAEVNSIIDKLDDENGVLLTSSYEYPGRYARWTVGFTAPALQIEGKGLSFDITPLNERGIVISTIIHKHLSKIPNSFKIEELSANMTMHGEIIASNQYFPEEERSKQSSLFSLIREITSIFDHPDSNQLGLYGSFGYDLTFQFEQIALRKDRDPSLRDLVLYFPDEILIIDNQKNDAWKIQYDFSDQSSGLSTVGKERKAAQSPYIPSSIPSSEMSKRDGPKGSYAQQVIKAKEQFRLGNLFEVVLSQAFREKLTKKPSEVFKRLCKRNPSPYGFFMNLGKGEYLIGASPEMFVRVETTKQGLRVETCPISGTIERGRDALEDAQQVKKLLLSSKEESELTMCTDVDRNDKSRICEPGSVRVLGRRQIEMYSRLIHTVDHVEGYLRKSFDALDAFLCHTWAVTVTGAPKTWAIRFIEEVESRPRRWYGGAVGIVGFDGSLNTGLTLRTINVVDGIGEVRAGATLLFDSDPDAEEAETELKASALIDAVVRDDAEPSTFTINNQEKSSSPTSSKELKASSKVLLIDHEDSFVHTLANYIRQSGAEVVTCRSGANFNKFVEEMVETGSFVPDLAVLSPGPGSPSDFQLSRTISALIDKKIPIFGVCLGLQGLTEHFGGKLGILDYPMHGKPSYIYRHNRAEMKSDIVNPLKFDVLDGLPAEFQVGRYHSLHAKLDHLPLDLVVTASTADGCVMALQHASMPIAAVQFHPESILTLPTNGLKIINNALTYLKSDMYPVVPLVSQTDSVKS